MTFCILAAVSNLSAQTISPNIRLNSVGFIPDFPKKASILADSTLSRVIYTVNNASTNTVVYRDTIREFIHNSDTKENLWIADFSELTTPGSYYISVTAPANFGRSAAFRIAQDAFTEAYRTLMLGMYLWRCGSPTGVRASYNGVTYNHGACHLDDATASMRYIRSDGLDVRRDAAGGWHDAGDYNKYIVNSGVSVAMMLKAWEHFSHVLGNTNLIAVSASGQIPAFLTEVKWNLDWVAKMQYPNEAKVSHKLSAINFCGNILPERETGRRFFVPWSTAATGSFVGMLAQASRIYRQYDRVFADSCLAKARRSYDLLVSSSFAAADQSAFSTGQYGGGDSDQRLWAAAEMWEATGESKYLDDLENRLSLNAGNLTNRIEWSNVAPIAAITYLNSQRPGRDPQRVEAIRAKLISTADGIVNTSQAHGYGNTYPGNVWGSNGMVARTSYILHSAYKENGDVKYRHAIADALSHLLGRNYFGRSFVTQLGHNPPQKPHCRRSAASGRTWPGYLVGGPTSQSMDDNSGAVASPQLDRQKCASLPATCWYDYENDYARNEIAINWNTAMIYALSAALPDAVTSVSYQPGQSAAKGNSRSAQAAAPRRVIKTQRNGKIEIPPGAKVYGLDGRLIGQRKAGESGRPEINRNGVFIIMQNAETDIKK
jgi:endoglucanase